MSGPLAFLLPSGKMHTISLTVRWHHRAMSELQRCHRPLFWISLVSHFLFLRLILNGRQPEFSGRQPEFNARQPEFLQNWCLNAVVWLCQSHWSFSSVPYRHTIVPLFARSFGACCWFHNSCPSRPLLPFYSRNICFLWRSENQRMIMRNLGLEFLRFHHSNKYKW